METPQRPSKLKAKLIALRYGNPSERLRVIVIAGRAGKTTTAHLVHHLLKEAKMGVTVLTHHMSEKSPWKDYQTNISTLQKALSHGVRNKHEYAIIEADEHLAGVLAGTTFSIDTIVALSDEPYIHDLLEAGANFAVVPYGMMVSAMDDHHVMTFGDNEKAEMYIEHVKEYKKGTEVTLRVDHHHTLDVASYLVGRLNAYNIAAALATMYVLSIDTDHFADGIAELEGVPGNYVYIESNAPYKIVADRGRTEKAIDAVVGTAKEMTERRLIVAIEDAPSDDTLKTYLDNADRIILVGDANHVRITPATSLDEAAALAFRAARQGDTVLFLGDGFLATQSNGKTIAQEHADVL